MEFLCVLSALLVVAERVGAREWSLRRGSIQLLGVLLLLLVVVQLLNPVGVKVFVRDSVYELVGGNLSLPHTIDPSATTESLLRWLCIFLFGFAVLHHVRTREDVLFLVRLLVINAALLSAEGILQNLSGVDRLLCFRRPRHGGMMFGPYVCRNNFASLANLSLPLAIGIAYLPEMLPAKGDLSRTPQRLFWGFCAAVMMAAIVLTSSRMGVVVSLFVVGCMMLDVILRRKGSGGAFNMWASLSVIAGMALMVPFVGGAMKVWHRFVVTSPVETERLGVWEGVMDAIHASPNWGYGLGTFQKLFPYYRPSDITSYYRYAHSDWLEAYFDFGLFGFVLVVLFFGAILLTLARERIRRTSSFRRSVAAMVFVSLAGCLLHALVDFPLHIASVQLTFVAIAAVGLASAYVTTTDT